MAQLQRARAVRLNMQLELCRDRRAREAFERAIEILEDSSDELLTAPAGAQVTCLCASSTFQIFLQVPLEIALSRLPPGCFIYSTGPEYVEKPSTIQHDSNAAWRGLS